MKITHEFFALCGAKEKVNNVPSQKGVYTRCDIPSLDVAMLQ